MYGNQVQVYCGGAKCDVDYAERIAHWARMELLKEKVKQRLEAKYGKQLDKIADLIVDVVSERSRSDEELANKEEALENAFDAMDEDGS